MSAAQLVVEWQRSLVGPAFVTVTDSGDAYVAGTYAIPETSRTHVFVQKYDKHGDLKWDRRWDDGIDGDESARFIGHDNEGNAYVCVVAGVPDYYGGVDLRQLQKIVVLKYNTYGNLTSTNSYGGITTNCYLSTGDFYVEAGGTVSITGQEYEDLYDCLDTTTGLGSREGCHALILRYDTSGTAVIKYKGRGSDRAFGRRVFPLKNGATFILAEVGSECPKSDSPYSVTGTAKLSVGGGIQWQIMSYWLDIPHEFLCGVDRDGNAYTFRGGNYHWNVRRYDTAQQLDWESYFGNTSFPGDGGVAVDGNGNIIVAGMAVVVKYDALGRELWRCSNQANTNGIDLDRFGNIFTGSLLIDSGGCALWGTGEVYDRHRRGVDANGNYYTVDQGNLIKFMHGKQFVMRDAEKDSLPNKQFTLIRISGNAPNFAEDTLGTFSTNSQGRYWLSPIKPDTFLFRMSLDDLDPDTISIGDKLKIAGVVHTEPSVRHPHLVGGMYSMTLDNIGFDENSTLVFDTLDANIAQEVVLDHTELRYNLVVSVEWDAALSYLTSLEAGFRAMSNYLYDVSDGQMRLDTVMIYDDKDNWEVADIKVYASNVTHPHVDRIYGITLIGPPGAPVEMPRKWFGTGDGTRNGTYAENPLNLEDDWDVRTKCHEFGHYALGFGDEYEFDDGSGGFAAGAGRCGAIDNYGFMDKQWESAGAWASEMSSIYRYSETACQNTEQFVRSGGSCWDNLEERFERRWGADSIFVPIITPDDAERELPDGLEFLNGPNGEMFTLDYDVGASVRFPHSPYPPGTNIATLLVQVTDMNIAMSKVDITVHNDYFGLHPKTIYEGQTADGSGALWAVGVFRDNRLIQASKGSLRILPQTEGASQAAVSQVWLCGEASAGGAREKRVSNQSWAEADSVTIELRTVDGDYPLICGVVLGADTSTLTLDVLNTLPSPPTADIIPEGGGLHSHSFTSEGSSYVVRVGDTLGDVGMLTIWAKDGAAQDFFFNTAYTAAILDAGAVSWCLTGPQGDAEVWLDTANTTLQKGMILSSPYLIIRTGLDDANIQAGETHSLSLYPPAELTGNNRVTIHYADSDLDPGTGPVGTESSLQVYHWNAASHQWELVGGTVDTVQNMVSAAIAEVGVYAAFTTETVVGIEDEEQGENLPCRFELNQNYPNPFNPGTTIQYSVPTLSDVSISVFNVLGQKVRTLVQETKSAGFYRTEWDGLDDGGRPVSTGVYLYRFRAGEIVQTKKMLLLK